jgi:hypothetical protein
VGLFHEFGESFQISVTSPLCGSLDGVNVAGPASCRELLTW